MSNSTTAVNVNQVIAEAAPQAEGKKLNRKQILIGGVAAVVLLAGARSVYSGYFYVTTDNATVQAQATLLSSKISGIILKANVQENQKVKAGQILVEIKPDDFQAQLDQLIADQGSLEAQVRGAEITYRRTLGLFQKGASTRERLDTSMIELQSLQKKLKGAEAQANLARLNLGYTQVAAPSDGKVGRKSFEIGMLASAGQPLLGFVAGNERWVTANLKETDMSYIAPGKHAYIEVDAIPGKEFEGEVESISPTTGATFSIIPPDNATGNFTKVVQRVPVRIKLLNLSESEVDQLQSGLSAEVRIRVR